MLYDKYTCSTQNPGLRKDYIGASDAPVIMGDSPWMTPLQLYEIKLGLVEQAPPTPPMLRGIELEEVARHQLSVMLGCELYPYRSFSERNKFMMANFDAANTVSKAWAEIKCPINPDPSVTVPQKYYAQLQHQMYVQELDSMYYCCWNELSTTLITVDADPKYQKLLVEKETEFYDRLRNFDPPPPTDRDYCKRGDEEWRSLAEEYKYLNLASKEIDAQLKECKERLILEARGLSSRGFGVTLSKSKGRETIDYKAACESLCEPSGGELKKYTKQSQESWRITT